MIRVKLLHKTPHNTYKSSIIILHYIIYTKTWTKSSRWFMCCSWLCVWKKFDAFIDNSASVGKHYESRGSKISWMFSCVFGRGVLGLTAERTAYICMAEAVPILNHSLNGTFLPTSQLNPQIHHCENLQTRITNPMCIKQSCPSHHITLRQN